MSLVPTFGPIFLPNGDIFRHSGTAGETSATLDASGEYVGVAFQFQKTGVLKKIAVRVGTVTVADAIIVRIETIDPTNGRPSGTLYATGAEGTISNPTSNTTYWVNINGTNGISVTKGDYAAIKVTLDYVDGNLGIFYYSSSYTNDRGFPYTFSFLNNTWTANQACIPNFGFQYDSGMVPYLGFYPATTITNNGFNISSSPNRYALRFKVPYRARLTGVGLAIMTQDCNLILYGPDGSTVLTSVSLDNDIQATTAWIRCHYYVFPKEIDLEPGVYYRLAVVPTTVNGVNLRTQNFTNDSSLLGIDAICGGSWFHQSSCTNAPSGESSWTNSMNARPLISLIVDRLDDGHRFNCRYLI